jgi:hypothetical protein
MPALLLAAVLGASASSQAQELRPDITSNGTLIGAGTGAAAGALIGLVTEDICSPGACAYLGAVGGGLLGRWIDTKIGHPSLVAPGSFVDDGLLDGALLGALSGIGVALIESRFRCRPAPDRGPCTRHGVLRNVARAAQWMTLVGVVVDAVIPSRLPGQGTAPARSQRLAVRVDLRF